MASWTAITTNSIFRGGEAARFIREYQEAQASRKARYAARYAALYTSTPAEIREPYLYPKMVRENTKQRHLDYLVTKLTLDRDAQREAERENNELRHRAHRELQELQKGYLIKYLDMKLNSLDRDAAREAESENNELSHIPHRALQEEYSINSVPRTTGLVFSSQARPSKPVNSLYKNQTKPVNRASTVKNTLSSRKGGRSRKSLSTRRHI